MKKIIMLLIVASVAVFSGVSEAKTADLTLTAKSDPAATRGALEDLKLHQHTGIVSKYDREAGNLVIKNKKGEFSLSVNAETQIKIGREKLGPEELKPGMTVTVRYWEKEGKKIARIVKLSKD